MAVIAIGSIICIVAAIAGDTSQDLKTGYILGATPVKQQMGELVGVFVSALTRRRTVSAECCLGFWFQGTGSTTGYAHEDDCGGCYYC